MINTRMVASAFSLGLACTLVSASATGQVWQDKKSTLTVTTPLEIPGMVLEPGTYVIKVVTVQSNRNVVQITNVEENKTFATLLATPHVGVTPPQNTTFVYFNTPSGSNRVLRTWFAPNDRFGQDFVYSKDRAAELARLTNEKVPEMTADMSQDMSRSTSTDAAPAPIAKAEPAPPAPVRQPDAVIADSTPVRDTSPATSDDTTRRLPRTASPYPMLLALGFFALAVAATLRFTRRSPV